MAGSDRNSVISGASTPEKIGEYWDVHSLDDSPMVREVEFEVHARRRRRVTLDPDLYDQAESEARIRGVSPETLANRWLTEKVLADVGRPPNTGRASRTSTEAEQGPAAGAQQRRAPLIVGVR